MTYTNVLLHVQGAVLKCDKGLLWNILWTNPFSFKGNAHNQTLLWINFKDRFKVRIFLECFLKNSSYLVLRVWKNVHVFLLGLRFEEDLFFCLVIRILKYYCTIYSHYIDLRYLFIILWYLVKLTFIELCINMKRNNKYSSNRWHLNNLYTTLRWCVN